MQLFQNTALGVMVNRAKMISPEYIFRRVMSDKDLQKYILDLIRIEQLFERGEDSDGDILGYYSEYTEMLNPEKIAGTPYTLKDTGAFYDSFLIYIYKNYFEIDADPIKTDENGQETNLFYEFSENIIGLNEQNLDKTRDEIREKYRIELRKLLQID
jgi:hypothetical protein